jgi:outer membrane biosynthesis protein TonB
VAAATVAPEPRLSMGIAASVVFHIAAAAAFIFLAAPPREAPTPPLYRVQLLAAPAGPRAAGVVQPPDIAPTPPTPAPIPKSTPETKLAPKVKPKTVPPPKKATPVAPPKTTTPPPKTETAQPKAGGGAVGGKGADESPLDTQGLEFPYPAYLQNVVREVIHQFQTQQTRLTLSADVGFMIRRDGTVDPNSIRLVKGSGNYAFDQQALGAVEAAGNAKRFGPLPAGFREDILPVVFRFTPALR